MATGSQSWFATSDVVPMFPTLVWKLQVSEPLRVAIEASALPALRQARDGLAPLSAGQGWQSQQALHREAAFAQLASCIEQATQSVLRFLQISCEGTEVTGCWATVLAPGASHGLHCHPNNFLSGVYYLRTRAGADRINFHDPRSQAAVIRPTVTRLTAENTDQVVVGVRDGLLLLFPSYLPHSVDANRSDGERISVSFNVMFRHFGETLSRPLWSAGTTDLGADR